MLAAGGFTSEGDVEAWAKVAEREANEELECSFIGVVREKWPLHLELKNSRKCNFSLAAVASWNERVEERRAVTSSACRVSFLKPYCDFYSPLLIFFKQDKGCKSAWTWLSPLSSLPNDLTDHLRSPTKELLSAATRLLLELEHYKGVKWTVYFYLIALWAPSSFQPVKLPRVGTGRQPTADLCKAKVWCVVTYPPPPNPQPLVV